MKLAASLQQFSFSQTGTMLTKQQWQSLHSPSTHHRFWHNFCTAISSICQCDFLLLRIVVTVIFDIMLYYNQIGYRYRCSFVTPHL